MAHYQPDADEPSIFGGVNDNPHHIWMGWHRFKFKGSENLITIGKAILKKLRDEEPRIYLDPPAKNLLDYEGHYAPLSVVIEVKYRLNITWEQADMLLLKRDGSDAFYARMYHQRADLTKRLHELAVSKGYDSMQDAISAAPLHTTDDPYLPILGAQTQHTPWEGEPSPFGLIDANLENHPWVVWRLGDASQYTLKSVKAEHWTFIKQLLDERERTPSSFVTDNLSVETPSGAVSLAWVIYHKYTSGKTWQEAHLDGALLVAGLKKERSGK